jgi:hypothetical protein
MDQQFILREQPEKTGQLQAHGSALGLHASIAPVAATINPPPNPAPAGYLNREHREALQRLLQLHLAATQDPQRFSALCGWDFEERNAGRGIHDEEVWHGILACHC